MKCCFVGPQKNQFGALVRNITKYLKAKVELWKFKYFTMQKMWSSKKPLKETKILQDIITQL
jgi:molybdopterin synthase catalytic subunit